MRVITPPLIHGSARVEDAEFNYGLGAVTRNRKHRAEMAKRMDLVEIGNEPVDKLHKHHDDMREKKWEDSWKKV